MKAHLMIAGLAVAATLAHQPAGHAASATVAAELAPTTVSLTFDDGHSNQLQVRSVMQNYGLTGTFYVNSGRTGSVGYLTPAQLRDLESDGNEIAGHTVGHADLTALSADEATREVCDDRVALLDMGLSVRSFAYPFGATDANVKDIVAGCGYHSARGVGGVVSPYGCGSCPHAETLPPADPYHTRTPATVREGTTVDYLKQYVTQAEDHSGGWVQIVFHHICDGCASNDFSIGEFAEFAQWLSQRPASTTVETVGDAIGGEVKPGVPGPPLPSEPGNLVLNPSLEAASGSVPSCFTEGGYGANSHTWSRTADARTGAYAHRVDITNRTSGDRKLVVKQDSSGCAPTAQAGRTYTVSVWFKGSWPSSAARIVTYHRNASGSWAYWQTGPPVAASATWKKTSFTTGAAPAGTTAISYGLALPAVGSLTTDDYAMADAG